MPTGRHFYTVFFLLFWRFQLFVQLAQKVNDLTYAAAIAAVTPYSEPQHQCHEFYGLRFCDYGAQRRQALTLDLFFENPKSVLTKT